MKMRRSLLVPTSLMVALMVAGLAYQPHAAGAEGLNGEYARLANGVVPSIERIAGRYFNGTIEIKGVPQGEMQAVLADDMKLARAEQLSEPEVARRSAALAGTVPVYYSIARHRIYFSADTARQRLKDGRLNPGWENEALRLLLTHELVRFLDDQQVDLKKLLGSAGSPAKARAYRAITAGHARMVTEILATQWNRPGVGELVSRWSLGEGAWQGLEKATSQAMDEEFSLCFDGGYRFASYIYDNYGADSFYRSFASPPVSASALFNPSEYKFEKTAEGPSSQSGVAAEHSGDDRVSLLNALKETEQFLPPGQWVTQVADMKELISDLPEEQQKEFSAAIADWQAILYADAKNVRFVFMKGYRLKKKGYEDKLMEASSQVEKGFSTGDKVVPEFGPPQALSGLRRGSGWLRNGKVSDASGNQSVREWVAACKFGDYLVTGMGINCTIDEKQASELFSTILSKLP